MNPRVGTREKSMRLLVIWAVKRTMAIFTKLFPTRSAARSCSGSVNSLITMPAERFLFDLSSLISLGSSEKSATSDPEISAERVSRAIIIIKPARVSDVKGLNPIFPQSVSK